MIDHQVLYLEVPDREIFDPRTSEFTYVKGQKLKLMHSLVSLSKWESKWHKPFLTKENKTAEETRDYIRCMTITQNVDPNVYLGLTDANIREVMEYIDSPMTATKFRQDQPGGRNTGQFITSELIYYQMAVAQIPFSCETWHLNRLLVLLRIFSSKNAPAKKMSRSERQALMARRRARKH